MIIFQIMSEKAWFLSLGFYREKVWFMIVDNAARATLLGMMHFPCISTPTCWIITLLFLRF